MPMELHELRLHSQMSAKEMVEIVRKLYPKYDKTLQSKCERSHEYGITLLPSAMDAVCAACPQGAPDARRKERHRLTCRISARLENSDYARLQQHIKADGYATMQDWLSDIVRRYLKEKEDVQ